MLQQHRLHALDAVRAFALLMGLVLHGAFSFIPGMFPGVWAFVDDSPSTTLSVVVFTTHIFRMSLFFFIAGLFGRMMWMRKGAIGFWKDRALRILLPLVASVLLIGPLVGMVWGWGIDVYFNGNVPPFPGAGGERPFGSMRWGHLWFLYVLCLLYAGMLAVRAIVTIVDRRDAVGSTLEAALGWLVRSGAAAAVLGLPLCALLLSNQTWVAFFGIPTPDNSFFTNVYAIVGFGTAFGVGWLFHRRLEWLQVLAAHWMPHMAGALMLSAACLYLNGLTPSWTPAVSDVTTTLFALGYCVALWCWVFGLTGMAMRFLNNESRTCRYLADSSYWLYLMHLPLVGALQILIGRWPLHWALKFPLLMAATLAILIGSYHLLVRNSYIGLWLNGRRHGKKDDELETASPTVASIPHS